MFQPDSKALQVVPRMSLFFAGVIVFAVVGIPDATAQVAPRANPTKAPEKSTPTVRTPIRRTPRANRPTGSSANSTDSYAFTDLGDVFFGKGKFNASEAAYNEALKIWNGNADAVYGMGLSKFFKGQDHEANTYLNRLRGMDSSLAAEFAETMKSLKSGSTTPPN
jgi:hypothetical protein